MSGSVELNWVLVDLPTALQQLSTPVEYNARSVFARSLAPALARANCTFLTIMPHCEPAMPMPAKNNRSKTRRQPKLQKMRSLQLIANRRHLHDLTKNRYHFAVRFAPPPFHILLA